MGATASQITSLTIVYSTVYSDADQIKHQSPASLAFVRRIHRGPANSPHKCPVKRKMFPFDDVIMASQHWLNETKRHQWPVDSRTNRQNRQRKWSTLAHVTACFLTAPSHYQNQRWLIISNVQWHSSEGNYTHEILRSSITKLASKVPKI